jgi:hypothetical protein
LVQEEKDKTMTNNPITQRVKAAFSKLTLPVNQEVTLNADGSGGPIISPSGHVGKAPSCGCSNKTCNCGKSPAKQTKKASRLYDRSEKLYNKSEQLSDRAENAYQAGKVKKSARIENRAIRKEEKSKKVLRKAYKAAGGTKKG